MAEFGSLGDIPFTVSDEQIQTFTDLKRTVTGRWEKIDRINKKPGQQFNGPDLETGSFEITISQMLNSNPKKVLKKLTSYATKGTRVAFVLAGTPVFSGKVVVTSFDVTYNTIGPDGDIREIGLSVNLEEYA